METKKPGRTSTGLFCVWTLFYSVRLYPGRLRIFLNSLPISSMLFRCCPPNPCRAHQCPADNGWSFSSINCFVQIVFNIVLLIYLSTWNTGRQMEIFQKRKPRNLLRGWCCIESVLLTYSICTTCPATGITLFPSKPIFCRYILLQVSHVALMIVLTVQRCNYFSNTANFSVKYFFNLLSYYRQQTWENLIF